MTIRLIRLVTLVFLVTVLGCGNEPIYQGKPMSGWVIQLKDSDPRFRREAAIALANIGQDAKSAVPALANLLTDKEENVRIQAAFSLACLGQAASEARPALKNAMNDPSAAVRINVAGALVATGESDVRAIQIVVESLKNIDDGPKGSVILEKMGPVAPTLVPTLIPLLRDPDPMVRIRAANVLGAWGPNAKASIEALAAMQQDEDVMVRGVAKRSLERIQK